MRLLPFSALWDFFRKFFNVLKGSSLQFVLIFCNRTNVRKSQRVPSFTFFGTMRLLKILMFLFLFRKFLQWVPLHFFWNFATGWLLKNLEGPPSTVFGIVRNFKCENFVFKKDRRFFYATFSKFVFIEAPLNFCLKWNVLRASRIAQGFRHYAAYRRPSKNFDFFFLIFLEKKMFPVDKDVFLLLPVGEEWFSRFMRIPSGIFWCCKIDEILTMSFYTWFFVWFCLFLVFFSSQPSAQVFAKHGFASVSNITVKRQFVPNSKKRQFVPFWKGDNSSQLLHMTKSMCIAVQLSKFFFH